VSITLKSKVRHNRREYSSPADLLIEIQKGRGRTVDCDDVMSVIESNGEVTIPKKEPLLTKKEVAIVAAFGAGILALVLARFASG
jgi:hypothetical protein